MAIALSTLNPGRESTTRFDLSLRQAAGDGVRILSMLRTRRCRLERFELRGRAECHVWIRADPVELGLIKDRLERLPGVILHGGANWERAD